jgi:hypothetical protein
MTLFPRQDIRCVRNDELKLLYAIVKASTYISHTSLVTHIASQIGALDGQDAVYISTPHIIFDEHYIVQGHHLKHDNSGNLVFYFLGIQMSSHYLTQNFICIKPQELTFPLVAQEETSRSPVSGRMTRSMVRNEAVSSQQLQPPHSSAMLQAFHVGWSTAE